MQLASTLLEITVMVRVYQMTSSVFMTSMIVGLMALSTFFSGLLVTRMIHRFKLKNILITTSLLRILIVINIYFFITSDLSYQIYIVMGLLVIQSFLSAWSAPARQSLIPLIFTSDQLRKVNTFVSTTNEIIRAIGWSIGGVLSLYLGMSVLIIIIVILLMLSVVFISFIKYNQYVSSGKQKVKGFKSLASNKVVLNITLVDMLEGVSNTIWTSALLLSFTIYVLEAGEIIWGYINGAYFAGSIIGGLALVTFFKEKEFDLFKLIMICGYIMGGLTLVMTAAGSVWIVIFAAFFIGPIYQIREVYQITALQIHTNDKNRTNIFSARAALLTPWNGVVVMLMGFVADAAGITMVYLASGIIYILSSFLVYSLSKRNKEISEVENE